MGVLPKRFGKYGLTLHPEKTRLVEFCRPSRREPSEDGSGRRPGTFDLLGFTHFWARSLKGNWVVKRKTAADRFNGAVRRIDVWCKLHRHEPLRKQWQALVAKVRGHYGYFGITANSRALVRFRECVRSAWRKWLSRRSRRVPISWEAMHRLLERYPLPPPRIAHPWRPA